MSADPVLWHDVCSARDLAPGGVKEVIAGDQMVAVANIGGTIYAMDGVCAHQGGPLGKGKLEACTLTCPWHGW
ncbi:MAG: Rieske (2Fe-2S) protein, partial [Planctomycetales bacterium]|nr:Rieske (2Fe-2S) protein [Planctomycetales bacterium]